MQVGGEWQNNTGEWQSSVAGEGVSGGGVGGVPFVDTLYYGVGASSEWKR